MLRPGTKKLEAAKTAFARAQIAPTEGGAESGVPSEPQVEAMRATPSADVSAAVPAESQTVAVPVAPLVDDRRCREDGAGCGAPSEPQTGAMPVASLVDAAATPEKRTVPTIFDPEGQRRANAVLDKVICEGNSARIEARQRAEEEHVSQMDIQYQALSKEAVRDFLNLSSKGCPSERFGLHAASEAIDLRRGGLKRADVEAFFSIRASSNGGVASLAPSLQLDEQVQPEKTEHAEKNGKDKKQKKEEKEKKKDKDKKREKGEERKEE